MRAYLTTTVAGTRDSASVLPSGKLRAQVPTGTCQWATSLSSVTASRVDSLPAGGCHVRASTRHVFDLRVVLTPRSIAAPLIGLSHPAANSNIDANPFVLSDVEERRARESRSVRDATQFLNGSRR